MNTILYNIHVDLLGYHSQPIHFNFVLLNYAYYVSYPFNVLTRWVVVVTWLVRASVLRGFGYPILRTVIIHYSLNTSKRVLPSKGHAMERSIGNIINTICNASPQEIFKIIQKPMIILYQFKPSNILPIAYPSNNKRSHEMIACPYLKICLQQKQLLKVGCVFSTSLSSHIDSISHLFSSVSRKAAKLF